MRDADGRHDDVCVRRQPPEVDRLRVRDRDGRIRLQQQVRHRLPDDVRAPDHDGPRPGDLDAVLVEQPHHAERGGGDERRPAQVEQAGVGGMESVDVLRRVERLDRHRLVEVLRQRRLDEDAVDRVVVVQLLDHRDQLLLRDVRRKPPVVGADPDLLRRLVLAADVDVRRGIVADEHGCEADVAELGDVRRDLGPHLRRERPAVHDRRRHRRRRYLLSA